MNLEEARSAKQEFWSDIDNEELWQLGGRVALAHADRTDSVSGRALALRSDDSIPLSYVLSVGVSVRGSGDFGVAVRARALRNSYQTARILRGVFERPNVDFRIIGSVRSLRPWYRDVVRPLRIGPSVGHHAITAGTLGAFVSVRGKNGEYMLSNNHVLANVNSASHGDLILQPGPSDNLAPNQLIAGIFETAVPLRTNATNRVDCAIAKVDQAVGIDPRILWNVGSLAGTDSPSTSDIVFKIGRTTGLSWGRITAIELDVADVVIGSDRFSFENQIEVEGTGPSPFSRGGDSGSLVVNTQRRAIGLLFAGSTTGGSNGKGLTYVNPIGDVLSSLDATFV